MGQIDESLNVYNRVNTLKDETRLRQGWVVREVPGRLESVSEHCFAMSNLAILINLQFGLNLDMTKVLTMINIHEYGEVKIGDLTPLSKVSAEDKHAMEYQAVCELMEQHPGRNYILNLWQEFEERETDEAIFVFLLDKFQAVLQAKEYSKKHNMPELFEEFYNHYLNIIKKKGDKLSESAKLFQL